jgi:hypothetical protein
MKSIYLNGFEKTNAGEQCKLKKMETNIREETEWKKTCQWCKWFTSYQDEYEDELEPSDFGRCGNDANSDKDECFGDGLTCDLFERVGK